MDYLILVPSVTIAFAVTVAFMFALRPVAISIGLVDRPGGRKSHVGEVPIVGGIAMFAGVFCGLTIVGDPSLHLPSLIVASMILIIIGALDDKYALPPMVRVASQIATVLIMFFGAGLQLSNIGDPLFIGPISLGPFALIGTMLVSLTVINAYNLIDGVDGLAGSLALIALLSIAASGGLEFSSTIVALTITASVIGFLLFNFPVIWNRSVRSFMGDAGSTFLGFVIVWTALGVSQGDSRVLSPVYCLWFASIPIYDLLTCFVRRLCSGRSPFKPGRDHFHHTLKRGGMGVREVLGVLTGFQVLYAGIGLAAHKFGIAEFPVFAIWMVLAMLQRSFFKSIAKYNRLRLRHVRGRRAFNSA